MPDFRIVPRRSGAEVSISATSFLAYQQCPARAEARYQGRFSKPSRASFTGSLAHGIFRQHLQSGPISHLDFADACRREIGSSPRLNETMVELGIRFGDLAGVFAEVRAIYERFARLPQERLAGAELRFSLAPAEGVTLVGQIDAVYLEIPAGHRLVDWKTGELGDAPIQMGFYALLWALDSGEIPARVEAISVKTGESFAAVPRADDVADTANRVTAMVDALRAGWASGADWERRAGPWCRHCPILEDCPEGTEAVGVLDGSG